MRTNNPKRLFSPFGYADTFRKDGFLVEKLVPFTAPVPNVTCKQSLGTTFWLMRGRKLFSIIILTCSDEI